MVRNVMKPSPFIELRLAILAVFGLKSDALQWIDWIMVALFIVPAFVGLACTLSKENPDISGAWLGLELTTTSVNYAFVLISVIMTHSTRLMENYNNLSNELIDASRSLLHTTYKQLEPRDSKDVRVGWTVLAVTFLAVLVCCILEQFIDLGTVIWSIILVAALVAAANGLSRLTTLTQQGTRLTWFWFVIGFYAFVMLLTAVGPAMMGGDPTKNTLASMGGPLMLPPDRPTPYNSSYVSQSQLLHYGWYPVCGQQYLPQDGNISGDELGGWLTALDLIVFADAIYLTDPDEMEQQIRNATHFTTIAGNISVAADGADQVGRIGVFKLPDIHAAVIAIRGSTTPVDWLFNLEMWLPAVLYRVVVAALPFGAAIPKDFATQILSTDLMAWFGLEPSWQSKLESVRAAVQAVQEEGYRAILTGHSLGGGLGQLFAASLGVPALVFSPVGMSTTEGRTGLRGSGDLPVENTVTSILPWGDVVPLMDGQTGNVHHIQCNTVNPGACHNLRRTACEIFRKCGDPRGRDLTTYCSAALESKWDNIPMTGFYWASFGSP